MNFDELSDEIKADDWLIPREELTRRRVIRRTAHYTIYKADWFGDVLVYEPNNRRPAAKSARQDLALRMQTKSDQAQRDTSRQRPSELCINISANSTQARDIKPAQRRAPTQDQTDSAYSSISSSPQCCNKQHEFEFPDQVHQAPGLNKETLVAEPAFSCFNVSADEQTCALDAGVPDSPSVVLNRNSFNFAFDSLGIDESAGRDKSASPSGANWFELNELRLVAHDNFMLFMGASMDASTMLGECSNQSTALVMETIKPKSVSLFNLLHASKSRPVSPNNR